MVGGSIDFAGTYVERVMVLADGSMRFDGSIPALLRAGGELDNGDLERALVEFLTRSAAQAGPA